MVSFLHIKAACVALGSERALFRNKNRGRSRSKIKLDMLEFDSVQSCRKMVGLNGMC